MQTVLCCSSPGCTSPRSFVRQWVTLPHDRARFPRDTPSDFCGDHRADPSFMEAWKALIAYDEAHHDLILYHPREKHEKECLAELSRQTLEAAYGAWFSGTPDEQTSLIPILQEHLAKLTRVVQVEQRMQAIAEEKPTWERGKASPKKQLSLFV